MRVNLGPKGEDHTSEATKPNAARGVLNSSFGIESMKSRVNGHCSLGKVKYDGPHCQMLPSITSSGVVKVRVGISAGFKIPGTCCSGSTVVSSDIS